MAAVRKVLTDKTKSILGAREHYKKMKAEIQALTEQNKRLKVENARLFEKLVQATTPRRLKDLGSI